MLPNTSVLEFRTLKKTRRYGAKRRTGCITCKDRRVKCDERKPFCLRCSNGGYVCGGYADTQTLKISQTDKDVIQKQQSALLPAPKVSAFEGDTHYLEFYYHCASPLFSLGRFDDSVWSRTALQMAQSESAIRHALIALGYLFKTEPGSLKHARSDRAGGDRTFLLHYNRAVRSLVDRMSDSSYSPQVGLVTTLLFVCIEFLRGNHHAAFVHLKGGLNMLSAWQKTRSQLPESHHSSPSFTTPPSDPMSIVPRTMMENNVTQLLTRTIAPAVLFNMPVEEFLPRGIPSHQLGPFSNILEAQSVAYKFNSPSLVFIIDMSTKIMSHEPITTKDMHHQTQLLEAFYGWFQALRLLEPKLSDADKVAASSLKVGYYAAYIGVACILDVSQMSYDAHLPSFKDMIKHAKLVLDRIGLRLPESNPVTPPSSSTSGPSSSSLPPLVTRVAANFTFEISVIPSLYFAALRCRDPATRREAASLLALNPPREGLWDGQQHAVVAKRIIDIEERQVDENGWSVENSRLWCAMIDPNMDQSGRFSVVFAFAKWVQDGGQVNRWGKGLERLGAQWEERFTL